jgi:UDP-N-acetylglucosamine--N-acetylmuramyl-(pentapeptide) pyrophosphoryl-undecaprenol N-acetylglucosamine transferase
MRVVISGGGTAGHINPAVAIGEYILKKEPDSEILYIGSSGELEKRLYGATGSKFRLFKARGLSRKNILSNFGVLADDLKAYRQIKKTVSGFKPDVGVSAGGYISAISMFALKRKKIPFIIHEQNAYPGLSTRFLSKYAKKYALAFMSAKKYLKNADLAVFTGNPLKPEILEITREQARRNLGFSPSDKVILCFGGSLGAEKLNEAFLELAKKNKDAAYCLIIGTGERYFAGFTEKLGEYDTKRIKIHKYITNMAEALAAADLAVTRSGAMTVSELAAIGKPAILIPSPNVTADHQNRNADELVNVGGALKIFEKELTASRLEKTIDKIITDEKKLSEMSKNLKKIAVTDAGERIYRVIKSSFYTL